MTRSKSHWRWATALAIAVLFVGSVRYLHIQAALQSSLDWIGSLGPAGPILFIAVYAAAVVLFVPGSILTVGAGALFGVGIGSACVSIASTIGATGAFLIGRYLARNWVAEKIQRQAKFAAIDQAVANEGWKIVGLTRLSPVFPFTLLNYAFGLTRVSLRDYILASWIGMMPGTVLYVYLGSLARAGAKPESKTPAEWILYSLGLLATIGVTLLVTRIARNALTQRFDATPLAKPGSP